MKSLLFAFLLAGCLPLAENDRRGEYFFVRSDGADLPVWVRGNTASGVFIILLPGGPGTSGVYLYPKSEGWQALEKDYAVVYHDQRGSGASQGNVPASSITLEQFLVDNERLLQVLRARYPMKKLILAGHSWGGMLGTAYLAQHPQGIDGWIEIDGAHNVKKGDAAAVTWVKSRAAELIAAGQDVGFWQDALGWYDAHPVITNETLNQHSIFGNRALDKSWIDESRAPDPYSADRIFFSASDGLALLTQLAFRQYPRATPDSAWGDTPLTRVYHDIDLTPQMKAITLPSLVLWGAHDPVLPPELADDALQALGCDDKQQVLFARSGHNPFDEEPQAFAAAVHAFVEHLR
jgi:proline iminopeptidase